MAGPKSSSAPVGAAPADSQTATVAHAVQTEVGREYTPEPSGRRASPAPVEALSAYEEEMLRAYSRTLAGTYERWKEDGEDMPLVLAVMLRQWRTAGCPAERAPSIGTSDMGTKDANSAPDPTSDSNKDSFDDYPGDSCGDCTAGGGDETVACTAGVTTDPTSGAPVFAAHSPTGSTTDSRGKPATLAARGAAKNPILRESAPKAKAEKADKKTDKSAQMTLPGVSVPRTPGETAPMSNYLARTSLFAPIRKGRRVMHDKQMLHSPEGIDVLYTGKQLDMADQDVYLTALRLAGGIKAGDRILINRAAFLRMLGYKHNPGARDYKWLEESFYRISTGRVIIKAKHIEANLPLMGALLTDTRSGDYYFTIPRETYALWAKNLYSYIDLEKRHALERNVPLSKWLQSYAQSHAPGTHTISMDLLHLWCGYGGRLRDFRDSLTGALDELTRVGILTSWSVQERGKGRQKKIMISWVRERTHRDDAPPPLVEG